VDIRRLDVSDAPAFVKLRAEALEEEPLSFGASPSDDVGLKLDSVRTFLSDREGQAVFGQVDGPDLRGTVGLFRFGKVKVRHKAGIWGMYVQPELRNQGIGRALLLAAVDHATQWGVEQLHLSVTEASPAARHLYEAAGFRAWGRDSRSLCWNGQFVDEYHLVLHLSDPLKTG